MEHEDFLRAMYEAFNARDIDAVLRQMVADVDWPNAWEGGRVHGRQGVRDYWTRQWTAIDPAVEPVAFTTRSDGNIAVEVDQVSRGLDGTLLDRSDSLCRLGGLALPDCCAMSCRCARDAVQGGKLAHRRGRSMNRPRGAVPDFGQGVRVAIGGGALSDRLTSGREGA
jgi:hypothetical protein